MNPYGAKQLANSFQTVRKNTIQIAEDIPDSQYGFVPAEGARSVARMLVHIGVATRLWIDMHGTKKLTDLNGYDFLGMLGVMRAEEEKTRSKEQILDLLKSGGDEFVSFLGSLSDDYLAQEIILPRDQGVRSRLESLLGAKEHEMHHRSQLMLIERMLGIVPHLTRQFTERVRELEKHQAALSQPA